MANGRKFLHDRRVFVGYRMLRLTRDVKNPHPDRRRRGWESQPIIKAGTILRQRIYDDTTTFQLENGETKDVVMRGHVLGSRYDMGGFLYSHDPLYSELIAASEEIAKETDDILRETFQYAEQHGVFYELVKRLLDKGVVTLAQLQELDAEWSAELEAAEAAQEKA